MHIILLAALFMTNIVEAGVGKVLKVTKDKDAHLIRENKKLPLTKNMDLELNDEIVSGNSTVLLGLDTEVQISLDTNSQLKLSEHTKTYSVIDLLKGTARTRLFATTEFQLRTDVAAASLNEGEFEMSYDDKKNADIYVFKKQVQVSSPFIQSFVPETVNAKEGLRFDMQKKAFTKIKFEPKFTKHPGFKKPKKKK